MPYTSLLLGAGSAICIASFFEWAVHRFVMHKPVGGFTHAFRAHALVHHQTFKRDHTYHLKNESDKHTIPMAWWNGPVLILGCMLPVLIASLILGDWALPLGALPTFSIYYGTYEYMHWCMHLPKSRCLERSWLFRRFNGHHLLHHRYMHKNFNVVLPLADLCLGTLLPRSKVTFAQPTGMFIANVQPQPSR